MPQRMENISRISTVRWTPGAAHVWQHRPASTHPSRSFIMKAITHPRPDFLRNCRTNRIFGTFIAVLIALTLAFPAWAKKPVRTAADLPTFTYPIDRKPSELLLADDATFAAFAKPVRADIERTLADYDIQDAATLRGLLDVLLNLQTLAGEDEVALETVQKIRALQDKPVEKLWRSSDREAYLKARIATRGQGDGALQTEFKREYAAFMAVLPWELSGSRAKRYKSYIQNINPALVEGQIKASIDPAAEQTHALGNDSASFLILGRSILENEIPMSKTGLEVVSAYIAANNQPKPDIWAARDIDLTGHAGLTPVRVGSWDSGIDPQVYSAQMFTDPNPGQFNPHGLAFDLNSNLTNGDLMPLTEAQQRDYPAFVDMLKGQSDSQADIDSPEADAYRKKMAAMKPDEASTMFELMTLYGQYYIHGSHVAGIAVRGNPAVQLVAARQDSDGWKSNPTAPTLESTRHFVASDQSIIDYFKSHGVRVVNMSWTNAPFWYEHLLERNGIGKDVEERKRMAQAMFDIEKAGLEKAFRSAPEILFITVAGNSNEDASFGEFIPASFKLPNLLTVGAVDQAGDETSFTSYGETVRIHSNGHRVMSRVPGGYELPASGTSMSAPQVTNLAAKLLALHPELTPEQVIDLIVRGATPSADGRLHLINPKASVALLQQQP
jgi:hypothetical protein